MQIAALDESIETLTFEASPHRTPGLHLSQIIKSICIEMDPKRFKHQDGPLPWDRFEAGFSFERVLEMAFQSRRDGIFRPGEIERDGIICSPDGIDPTDWRLEEFKFTWMSSYDAPEHAKFRHWLWQMQAYCYVLGTTRSRLRAFFVNGNYRGHQPEYRVWNIDFTEEELDQNWRMLKKHARDKGLL